MKKFIAAVLLLALLGVGWFFGLPAYRVWKEKRATTQARDYLAQKDYTNAVLAARAAIVLNANNTDAWIVRARAADAARLPVALELWQRVINLNPAPSNQLAFARAALLAGKPARATQALLLITAVSQNNAEFHELAGLACLAERNAGQRNVAAADWHFEQAAKLDPANKAAQLNQAILRAQARKPEIAAVALKTLESFTTDPLYAKDALRHLAAAALRDKDATRALDFATRLANDPGAQFDDRLLKLSVLQDTRAATFPAELAATKAEAAKDPEDTYTLVNWLTTRNLAADALAWLASLPAEAQAKPAIRLARADVLQAIKDWPALEKYLTDENWAELDFIRLAQLSRAASGQGQRFTADAHWSAALRAAAERLKPLTVLARLTAAWGWDAQREEVLNLIIQRYPSERWAFAALDQQYTQTGDTRGLQKVFNRLVEIQPTDAGAKNNLAYYNLLLGLQPSQSVTMARDNYADKPTNAICASTFAFALHMTGHDADALKVLQKLTPAQLEYPGIPLCYGLILAGSGDKTNAAKYLDLAAKDKLLPEELKLLKKARGEE